MPAPKSDNSPVLPSLEAIAEQLGVDMATEPNVLHIVSSMQSTSLPPTWTAVDAAGPAEDSSSPRSLIDSGSSDGHHRRLQYVNRLTGETTSRHPGATYFSGMVQRARMSEWKKDSKKDVNKKEVVVMNGRAREEGGSLLVSDDLSKSQVDEVESLGDVKLTQGGVGNDGMHIETRSKWARVGKGRMPLPAWLVFTSWWHETTCGTENTMARKHAYIRFETTTGAFEVELEDVPSIFVVSHATGRYGKVGLLDLFVGAQLNILGRQMRLMQCDGPTARWLEGEVKAVTKTKAALVSAIEKEGEHVRCPSDRLELAASGLRGGGLASGHVATIDRRCILQDVTALRDILSEFQPEESRRLTRGVL